MRGLVLHLLDILPVLLSCPPLLYSYIVCSLVKDISIRMQQAPTLQALFGFTSWWCLYSRTHWGFLWPPVSFCLWFSPSYFYDPGLFRRIVLSVILRTPLSELQAVLVITLVSHAAGQMLQRWAAVSLSRLCQHYCSCILAMWLSSVCIRFICCKVTVLPLPCWAPSKHLARFSAHTRDSCQVSCMSDIYFTIHNSSKITVVK